MKNTERNAQTLVIGSLLLLALGVSLIIYAQVSIFPQLNERTEFSQLKDTTESMEQVEQQIFLTASSGHPTSVVFDNRVSYIPQPAGPPDQIGQLNFRGEDTIQIKNINRTLPFATTAGEFGGGDEHHIITYRPDFVELSAENRDLIYDNTVTGVQEPKQGNYSTLSSQSVVEGNTINIQHLVVNDGKDGVKQAEPTLTFTRVDSGSADVTNSAASRVKIEFNSEYKESTWEELVDNSDVDNISKSGNRVTIAFRQGEDYTVNYNKILVES
jgi:hypothetical protein